MFTRRQVLGMSAAMGGTLWWSRASAGREDAPCHLVVVTATGGWDVSYAIDPKPGSLFVDGPELDRDPTNPRDEEVVRTFADLNVTTNAARRPAVEAFFSAWADRALLVRGLWVGSISHDACATRVLTGHQAEGSPDIASMIADAVGRDAAIPYMDLGGGARTGPLAAIAGRAGRSNQLRNLLDRRAPMEAPLDWPVDYPQYAPTPAARADIAAWQAARDDQFAARWGGLPGADAKLADLAEARERAVRLRDDGQGFARQLGRGDARSLTAQVDNALDLLTSGLAHTVMVDSGEDWDTHTANVDQHARWENLMTGLDRLARGLSDAGLLDRTVVLVQSEMTRTPKRNAAGGKDHWPVTSALLFGGPLRGGRVLGASTDGLDAAPIRLDTGRADPGGAPLRYDQLAAGVVDLLGGDADRWFPGVARLAGFT